MPRIIRPADCPLRFAITDWTLVDEGVVVRCDGPPLLMAPCRPDGRANGQIIEQSALPPKGFTLPEARLVVAGDGRTRMMAFDKT